MKERITATAGIIGFSLFDHNLNKIYCVDYFYQSIDQIIPLLRKSGVVIPSKAVIQFTARWDWPMVQTWYPTPEEWGSGRFHGRERGMRTIPAMSDDEPKILLTRIPKERLAGLEYGRSDQYGSLVRPVGGDCWGRALFGEEEPDDEFVVGQILEELADPVPANG